MPFTVAEFHDLVRILEEHPEWRAEIRRLVLTDEILTLPELLRDLIQAQRRTEERVTHLDERVAALVEAQIRTEQQIAALTESQRGLEARMTQIEERMTQVEERMAQVEERMTRLEDRVAALVEAQIRTEQQIAALTEAQMRLEERMTRLEDRVAALVEAQIRTDQQIAALTEAQMRMERRIVTLTNDVAELKGFFLELRYKSQAHAYFAPLIRRTRVLSTEDLDTLLEAAVAQGQLSEAEADEIVLADLLLRGRSREDRTEVYVVVEVSSKIDPYDVERSVRRARLLSRLGTPAIPVVAGKEVIEEAANLANMLQVWQLTNGQVTPPQPHEQANDHSTSRT